MRFLFILLLFSIISSACYRNKENKGSDKSSDMKMSDQAVEAARNYAIKNLKDPKMSYGEDGTITISKDNGRFVIIPSEVVICEVDGDSEKDAIVPITKYYGNRPVMKEHLFLLNREGRLKADTVISDMISILKVEDRVIYAEISKVGMDSPGYGCASCMEIARYTFNGGRIERIK